jgi:hypothetical protein
MTLDPHSTHLAIRWLHVGGMAIAFGGAVLVLAFAIRGRTAGAAVLQIAASYEWLFWGAAGVLAMTGIGNLGAFGTSLPDPATEWGRTFQLKLVVVIALVLVSIPRTLAVAALAATAPAERVLGVVRRLYGGTSAIFALILALAITLAHG